jgi:hypothetical protein
MKKLLVTAFSALAVLLGAASVAAPPAADGGETVAARGGVPGLDGVEHQHNETLVRDEA